MNAPCLHHTHITSIPIPSSGGILSFTWVFSSFDLPASYLSLDKIVYTVFQFDFRVLARQHSLLSLCRSPSNHHAYSSLTLYFSPMLQLKLAKEQFSRDYSSVSLPFVNASPTPFLNSLNLINFLFILVFFLDSRNGFYSGTGYSDSD